MIKVTRELLRKVDSCYGAAREKKLIPEDGLSIREVAQLDIPVRDKIFAICNAPNASDNALREFACWCARSVLNAERKAGREPDPKCWTTVDVAERYARGEASKAELKAAWDAAYEDACVARDAVRAAYYTASSAAYEAAWYISDAAWNASGIAREAQLAELVKLLDS